MFAALAPPSFGFREPVVLAAVLFLLLLFPNGRLASPRWRIVAALGVVVVAAVIAVGEAFGPEQIALAPDRVEPNPVRFADPAGSTLATLAGLASVARALPVGLAVGGLVLRLRRARGVERPAAQVARVHGALLLGGRRFTLYAIAAWATRPQIGRSPPSGPADAPLPENLPRRRPLFSIDVPNDPIGAVFATILLVTAAFGLPGAISVAVLRHRLYDIDVVIRRTIVYSVLSATLGGAYLACVLALRELTQPLTGESGLAVAASTLAVAALFRPARTWIGAADDRRFYRGRLRHGAYVECFRRAATARGRRGRGVSRDMRAVIHETLQPAHVSIWLRDPQKRA